MNILELNDNRKKEWNAFVRSDPNGTFFHLAEWKEVIEKSFRFKTHYIYAEKDGTICGVLPLALVKRPLFGPALISSPLCVYGGALGEAKALEQAAIQKAEALGIEYLELRGQSENTKNWPQSEMFYTFRGTLSENHEENLKAIPRKQRAEVRKGIKTDLKTVVNQDIDLFYKIYAANVRDLGTPVFPKGYLNALIDVFGDACEITTIFHSDQPLTSVLSFRYKDHILPYYGGGLPKARDYRAYPYMYWMVMKNAVDTGARIFDFGRSIKGSGAFVFKKNFGFEPEALPYHYHLVKAQELPNMDPDSPRNKMLTSAWKKLPLPIANKIGPLLYPVIV